MITLYIINGVHCNNKWLTTNYCTHDSHLDCIRNLSEDNSYRCCYNISVSRCQILVHQQLTTATFKPLFQVLQNNTQRSQSWEVVFILSRHTNFHLTNSKFLKDSGFYLMLLSATYTWTNHQCWNSITQY